MRACAGTPDDGTNPRIAQAGPGSGAYPGHAVLKAPFPGHRELLDRVMEDRPDMSPGDSDDSAARIGLDAAFDILLLCGVDAHRATGLDAASYSPVSANPDEVIDIDAWTPEWRKNLQAPQVQSFLSPEFPALEPFAQPQTGQGVTDFAAIRPPAPEPFFLEDFADAKLDIASRTVTLSATAVINGASFGASVILPAGRSGFDPRFPESSMMLNWPDFDAAAREAGMSRIFGGMPFDDGNDAGLALGNMVGRAVRRSGGAIRQRGGARDGHAILGLAGRLSACIHDKR